GPRGAIERRGSPSRGRRGRAPVRPQAGNVAQAALDQGLAGARRTTCSRRFGAAMTRFWVVLSAALAIAGCATTGRMDVTDGSSDDVPTPRIRDSRAAAYYFYSVAQMNARAGRIQDAIVSLREAIHRDPDTAALWVPL